MFERRQLAQAEADMTLMADVASSFATMAAFRTQHASSDGYHSGPVSPPDIEEYN